MSRPNKVYLLMHASGQSFKIGIAVQTHRRAAALPDDIDMARSLEAVVTTGRADSVEKILHYLCRDLSTTAERVARGDVGDGYTEWFAAEAFDQVRAFIDGHAAKLGVSPLRPVQVPKKDERPAPRERSWPVKPSKAEKAEAPQKRLAERLAWRKAEAVRLNARLLQELALLSELKAHGLLLGLNRWDCALYFRGPGEDVARVCNLLMDVSGTRWWLQSSSRSGGVDQIFTSAFSDAEQGIGAVRVAQTLVREGRTEVEDAARLPFLKEIRQMMNSLAPAYGSATDVEMRTVRDSVIALKDSHMTEFLDGWMTP